MSTSQINNAGDNSERDPPRFLITGVLVGGVAGGLVIVILIILFCKYCMKNKQQASPARETSIFGKSSPVDEKLTFLQEQEAGDVGGNNTVETIRDPHKRTHLLHDQPSTDTQITHLPSYDEEADIDYAFAQYKESLRAEETQAAAAAAAAAEKVDLVEMGDWSLPANDKSNTPKAATLKKTSVSAASGSSSAAHDEVISGLSQSRGPGREPSGEPTSVNADDGKRVSFLLGDKLKHSHTLPNSATLIHNHGDQHGGHRSCRYTDGDYHHLKSSRIDRSAGVNTIIKQRSLATAGLDHTISGKAPPTGLEDNMLSVDDSINETTPMLNPVREESRSPRAPHKNWKQQTHAEIHAVAKSRDDRYRSNSIHNEPRSDGYRAKVETSNDSYHGTGIHGDKHVDSYRNSNSHIDNFHEGHRPVSSYGVFPGGRQHRGNDSHLYHQHSPSRNVAGSRQLPEPRARRRLDTDTRQCSSLEIVVPKDRLTIRENRRVRSYEECEYPFDDHKVRERGSLYKPDYDVELKSKVRYNDTGSLEDVGDDHAVLIDGYKLDDNLVSKSKPDSETDTLNGSSTMKQYRELWHLRATLEEEEDFSDTVRMEDMTSPEEQSTEERDHIATSVTTSFESNTEPIAETSRSDQNSSDETVIRRLPVNLLDPNLERKRQNYRGILTNRLKRQGRHGSGDNSFDSVETMETDGEISDTSRPEMTTTSFESTTDNTDSTGESTAHKLHQMQRDSGYKSLETQQSQNNGHDKTQKKQIHFVLDQTHRNDQTDARTDQQQNYRGKSPHKVNNSKPYFDRKNAKTASKKRREYRCDRQVQQLYDASTDGAGQEPEPETDSRSDQPSGDSFDEGLTPKKFSLFSKFMRSHSKENKPTPQLSRDYSMDEKTSAIFNEFLRNDTEYDYPSLSSKRSPRMHSRIRLQRKHGHASLELGGRHDRRLGARSVSLGGDGHGRSFRRLSPQDSIEEEFPPIPFDQVSEHPGYSDRTQHGDIFDQSSRRMSSGLETAAQGIPIIRLQDPEEN